MSIYQSPVCSCIICHKVYSRKGIHSHYIAAHTARGKQEVIARGTMGGNKSIALNKEKYIRRMTTYLKNPAWCTNCNVALPYQHKHRKFCSRSCSAQYNNRVCPKRTKIRRVINCIRCATETVNQKYCSQSCKTEYFLEQLRIKFKSGLVSDRNQLKIIIIEQYGHVCQWCQHATWFNDPIPLELDHIDGNAGNNMPDNLRVLCPTCHSLTPTAKGRNRGHGRKSRGLPLH